MKYIYLSVAILVSTGLLLWQYANIKPTIPPAQTQHLEWFGKTITLMEIDEQGQLKQTLDAQTLQHYLPENTTNLSGVKLHILPTIEQPHEWFLTSDKGRLFHADSKQEISRIDLWHNVQLLRPENETGKKVTMNTSTLAIFPIKEYAHTDQYTIVKQIGQQMAGDGMEIFFPNQEFNLINNVSSIHDNTG